MNLRRDLGRVAKRTRKFPRKYTEVTKKYISRRLSSISLANNRLMDVTQLVLTPVGWPNSEKTCFDLRANLMSTKVSASHRKSTQVHTSPGQMESQVNPSLQRASTCDSIWPGLNKQHVATGWPNARNMLPCFKWQTTVKW